MKLSVLLSAVLLLLQPLPTPAGQLPKPKVEFSADTVLEAAGLTMKGTIFHGRDRKRIEQQLQDLKLVIIARNDRNVGWMILDDQRSYLEMSLNETRGKSLDINDCDAIRKRVGDDTVNGIRAVKSRITLSCPDGTSYEGSIWMTPDDIVVKMDAIASDGTDSYPFRLDLKDLRIRRQEEKLFELPAGYRKLEIKEMLGTFGELIRMIPDREMGAEWKEKPPAMLGEETMDIKEPNRLPGF